MRIGIISDSHGRCDRLARAVSFLVQRGADALVHCGDLGDTNCLRALAQCGKPAYAVCGNIDRRVDELMAVAAEVGVDLNWEVIEVPLGDGRHLAATHGHDEELVGQLLAGQEFSYLCVGHSHSPRDDRVGTMRVINPGALHRARPHSVALLDTIADDLQFIEFPDL